MKCPNCSHSKFKYLPPHLAAKGSASALTKQRIGNWEIAKLAGEGGAGKVYQVYNPVLGQYAAIKVLTRNQSVLLERFKREARICAQVQHPGILRVYDFGESAGQPYVVMEWMDAGSVADRIDRAGAMPVVTVIDIGRQCCQALQAVHSIGVVHRDIKPDNIMMDRGGRIRISDFGLAHDDNASVRLTDAGMTVGTPTHMAPEQIMGQTVTPKTDIYAMGVCLFEMLTGKLPFSGKSKFSIMEQHITAPFPSMRSMVPGIPPALDSLIQKMCAKNPDDRPESMAAVDQVLAHVARQPAAPKYDLVAYELVGNLTNKDWGRLDRVLDATFKDGIKRIVLDFNRCESVSETTIGLLIRINDRVQNEDGLLVLVGLAPDMEMLKLFTQAEMHNFLTAAATVEDALEHLGGTPLRMVFTSKPQESKLATE